jgi:hypothetical protein
LARPRLAFGASARWAARRCSSSLAGSSAGSCGTSSPRKALASSAGVSCSAAGLRRSEPGFEAVGEGEQRFDAADDFVFVRLLVDSLKVI